jgi:hypothetical protein
MICVEGLPSRGRDVVEDCMSCFLRCDAVGCCLLQAMKCRRS